MSNARLHLKIVGAIYMCVGGFIVAFSLLALVFAGLAYFGKAQGVTDQGAGELLTVFLVLVYPASWIAQTGLALYKHQKSGRMWGIIVAGILLIGLNVVLLLLNDESAGRGFEIFHLLMIALGIYSLVLLVPNSIVRHLE